MRASEFVKNFGWEYAKERMEYCKGARLVGMEIELKRLVKSHELVMDYYGLAKAKEHAESKYTAPELKVALKQAIADVESCL